MSAPSDSLARPELLDDPRVLLPAVLQHLEATHERSQQHYPGHSSVGRCRRQAGYGFEGALPDVAWEPEASVQAWIGTAVHSTFLPVLKRLLHPARIELATTWTPLAIEGDTVKCHTLPPITGHVDLYRQRSALVLDLKTVSRHQLDYVRRLGDETGVAARPGDLLQVHANAASLRAEGKSVEHVALLYVCTETSADRADAEGLLWVQPVDEGLIEQAVVWWAEVTSTPAEALPRDERGPGLSWKCDGCPWLRKCWGPEAIPGVVGAQRVLAVDDPAVVEAMAKRTAADEQYTVAGREQRAADADRKFWGAVLSGTEAGTYRAGGQAYALEWKPGSLRLDQQEATDLLQLHGIEVPKRRGGRSLKITPVEVGSDG